MADRDIVIPQRALRTMLLGLRTVRGDGPSTGAVVRIALSLVGVLAGLYLLWLSRSVVQWVAISAFLAVAMNPLVGLLQRRCRLPRAVAIGVVYLLGTGVLALAALVFVPPLIRAAQGLVDAIPGYIARIQNSRLLQNLNHEYNLLDQVKVQATHLLSGLAGPTTAVDAAKVVVDGVLALVSVAVITFLFSLYGPSIRRWVEDQFNHEGSRARMVEVMDGAYKVIAGYVVGVCAVAIIGALAASAFMAIAGIPYIPVLALWVGLMTFIPLVGATFGAVPYITLGFFQGWPVGVAAIVYLVVYTQLESHLINPYIHRRTVSLNPLWIIIAVLVGTQVFAVIGALVAIPVAGIVQVAVQAWARGRDDRPVILPAAAEPPDPPAGVEPEPAG
ncbi:MAG: AI-2E family transporter [Thermoleophilia bacterium]